MNSSIRVSSASSSSAARQRRCKYDVFLSFRGKDTRPGFTRYLYDALNSKGITTFMDDRNLEVGDHIRPELLDAIENSRTGVVVLSTNYADSIWCLEEVSYIVDCMEKMGMVVVPVFYHVDPSDVRYQNNTFKEAFAKHENSKRYAPEQMETWKAALGKVGDLSGLHVQGTGYEVEVIEVIVRKLRKDLQDSCNATKGLVGIEPRVEELKSLLNMESNDIRFVGICGMSGMGKTTLAEVVYYQIRTEFQGSSFIANVKDASRNNDGDLCVLQQKLLADVLKDDETRVRSVVEGVDLLQRRLCALKVIIVLDDVNNRDQLEYLAGERAWFGCGSRIIFTTTNEDLLNLHGVDGIYKCEGLNSSDAATLFNLKAFTDGHPEHEYEKSSCAEIVKLAGGLPLALNAFGSLFLPHKSEEYWIETIEKLRNDSQKDVLQRLEICYNRLERKEQDIFIYIACFLRGRGKELVCDILKNIDLYPESGIDILINRSLISINYDDSVWMHDLLQQMGWEIVRREFPNRPGERIGLKSREDIVDICSSKEGTGAITIINQEKQGEQVENCIGDPKSFKKMKRLRFLRISDVDFPGGLEYLSNDLRILEWHRCSLKSFPTTFTPNQIYELEMCSSRLEKLWDNDIDLPNLRSANLSFSEELTELPDFFKASPKLVKLKLEGCSKLVVLPKSLLVHNGIRYLNLNGCKGLQSLGKKLEMEALEALHLSGCSKLESIPEFGEKMNVLEHLYLDATGIKRLPESLGNMHSLRKLDLSETDVEVLPSSVLHLERLRLLRMHGCRRLSLTTTSLFMSLIPNSKELDLSECNLSRIPCGIGLLSNLRELDLSDNEFAVLPASITLLSNLKMLRLNRCKELKSFPKLSYVNEDTVQIRFSYCISGEGVDASKFHSPSHIPTTTVSCLNCPSLIENESSVTGLAHGILKKYLKVQAGDSVIPEAIFEIVSAGSEIPKWFRLGRPHSITFKGIETKGHCLWDVFDIDMNTCIGIALCVVVVVPQSRENMEVKYEVVAHIGGDGRYLRIPIPINFSEERKLETQLVWYCNVSDDLRKLKEVDISFSVNPEDCDLELKKFGVHFLCQKDMMQPVEPKNFVLRGWDVLRNHIRKFKLLYFREPKLRSLDRSLKTATSNAIAIIASVVKHKLMSVGSLCEVISSLVKLNQEIFQLELYRFLPDWKAEDPFFGDKLLELGHRVLPDWKKKTTWIATLTRLHPSFGKELEFLYPTLAEDLKCSWDGWLFVQEAMQQIEEKRRAGTLTSLETVQLINDVVSDIPPLFTPLHTFLMFLSLTNIDLLINSDHFRRYIETHENDTTAESLFDIVIISSYVAMHIYSGFENDKEWIYSLIRMQILTEALSRPRTDNDLADYRRWIEENPNCHMLDFEWDPIIVKQQLINCSTVTEEEEEIVILIDETKKKVSKIIEILKCAYEWVTLLSPLFQKLRIKRSECSDLDIATS